MHVIKDKKTLNDAIDKIGLDRKFDISEIELTLISYEKGELISEPSHPPKYILFLVSGTAQIYAIASDGRIIPVNIAKSGAIIGDVEYCQKTNTILFAEATRDTICIGINISDNRKVLDNNISFLHFMLEAISQKIYLTRSMWDSPLVSVEEKLIEYMQNDCKNNTLVGVEEATMRVQCSRRQLQRVLAQLCDDGRIEKIQKGIYKLK